MFPLMLQMAGRILVLRPTSLSEFTDRSVAALPVNCYSEFDAILNT